MKNLVLLFAAISMISFIPSEAKAQRLLRRLFGVRPATTIQTPVVQQGYSYTYPAFSQSATTTRYRTPVPVTGYGSNLHRNYMIRRAQQKAAATGIQPRNTGNIYWGR